MMKYITVLFLLLFGRLASQTAFYIRPAILIKSGWCSSSSSSFTQKVINPKQNITYTNDKFSTFFPGFDIGLNIGLKTSRMRFEFGINQDISNKGAVVNAMSYPYEQGGATYQDADVRYKSGGLYYRYGLQGSYVLNPKAKTNKITFDIGISLADVKNSPRPDGFLMYLDDIGSQVEIRTFTDSLRKISTLFHFGFTDEVMYKEKYLFSASLFYTQGTGITAFTHTDLVYSSASENATYKYDSFSRGSGITFSISRRFQIYPHKKRIKTGNT
jgi:hypothetical protein